MSYGSDNPHRAGRVPAAIAAVLIVFGVGLLAESLWRYAIGGPMWHTRSIAQEVLRDLSLLAFIGNLILLRPWYAAPSLPPPRNLLAITLAISILSLLCSLIAFLL